MTLICEYCGEEDKESLQVVFNKWACWKCYPKKKYIELKIKETSDHRYNCTCHGCCSLIELGYKKIDSDWIIIGL